MRKLHPLLLTALVAILFPSALCSSGKSVEELIKRHLDALGGERAVRAINSVVSTAEMEMKGMGLKGTVQSQDSRPCLSRSDIALGFFKIEEGYDGERMWAVDPNGKLQFKRDAASLAYQKTICLLESQEYLFGGPGIAWSASGMDTANGVSCDVLELSVAGGTSAKLFLSDSTFLIERMEIKAPEGPTVQTFRDYRPVNGVMFPFYTKIEIAALGQTIEMRYQSITANARIDPVVFLPPSVDVKDYRFAKGRVMEEVPFTYGSHHLFLPVRIGDRDRDLLFLLDSGASMTVVDSSIAAEMKLPFGGKMPGAGAGGMAEFNMTHIPRFSVAGIEFSEQTAISFPIAELLRTLEEMNIGGILGYDFLSRFVTRIDYERTRISFFEPDSFAPRPGETAIEAPLVHNIFTLPVSLDGTKGTFVLDTGANSSLVSGSFVTKGGLASGRRTLPMAIRGAGGNEQAALCRFDSLSIGGITLPRPVLAITSGAKGISALENMNGVIGNDILERFTVTLDYKHQRVFLEPNGRFGEPFFKDHSGVQLARKEDRSILVVAVIPDSPSDKAGLRKGDIVLSVNGAEAARFASISDIMKLFEANPGTTYSIEVSRAKRRIQTTLTLAEYI